MRATIDIHDDEDNIITHHEPNDIITRAVLFTCFIVSMVSIVYLIIFIMSEFK